MTLRRLPESVTDALALSAGVAANFASSVNWRGESVRLDMLLNILPLVAAGQEQLSDEGCRRRSFVAAVYLLVPCYFSTNPAEKTARVNPRALGWRKDNLLIAAVNCSGKSVWLHE
jgi:hypothetical protein